jgi:dTDP-6-deoxy-L-talose 4-dehydrogenase (NAD+)
MKVLVTGASGFIGDYVIRELLKRGITVVATSAHKDKAAAKDWFDQVTYVEYDMASCDTNLLERFHHPEKLIHLAWPGLPAYKELFHFEKNLPEQYTFIRQLVTEGLTDITITGTCLEYGMKEGALSVDMPADPAIPYALAKDTLRKFLVQLQTKHPFCLKWVRLFYVYGKGQSEKSLFSQLEAAIRDQQPQFNMSRGEQVRDFIHVTDTAAEIADTALNIAGSGIFNCCSEKPVTVRQMVENYLHENKISIKLNLGYYPYNDYEPMAFWGISKKKHS